MKKISMLVLITIGLFTLSGCDIFKKEDAQTLPLITSQDSYTVEVASVDFDLTSVVTIEDEIDGSILLTSSMIDYKDFDINTLGDYTVLITVENSLNNTSEKEIVIHVVDTTSPTIELIGPSELYILTNSDYYEEGANVEDNYDTNIIVKTESTLDTSVNGSYFIKYSAKDSSGNESNILYRTVFVVDTVYANYQDGIDLTELTAEDRSILFAAAERYLLDNVYGGVPLLSRASYMMYSDRVDLYSPVYNGVMGFGEEYSQFTEDDSTVLMDDGIYGNALEYTWRQAYNTETEAFTPWEALDTYRQSFLKLFTGQLYLMHFDTEKTGYSIEPSLAKNNPVPEEGTVESINGKDYSKVWLIEVKDDLTWTFHEDTDTSTLADGYETLDANDFLWSFQNILNEEYFPNIHGVENFITHGIKNALEYYDGTITDFSEVGMSVVNGNTLRIEFNDLQSEYDVKYMFMGTTLSPVNQELFESLGVDSYGQSPETVASSGVYVFDTWTALDSLTFIINENHPESDLYHYTGYQYSYMDDTDEIFNAFIAGKLDSASVPYSQIPSYFSESNVYPIQDLSIWSLAINGFGTEENRDNYLTNYPNSEVSDTFVPEAILMYPEMRQALYWGFDRQGAAENANGMYVPEHTLVPSIYFLDSETGISIRATEAGASIVSDFSSNTYGFDASKASLLFQEAVSKGIEAGYYTKGSSDSYTEITLNLVYSSNGNVSIQNLVEEIKRQYEEILIDDINFVKIIITTEDVDYPFNYNQYISKANCDLGLAGLYVNEYNMSAFDKFRDDRTSSFTFNYGADTHSSTIEVSYHNTSNREVTEVWSYNALIAALKGQAYIKDGQLTDRYYEEEKIKEYLYYFGKNIETISIDTEYTDYIRDNAFSYAADIEEIDSVTTYFVSIESGRDRIYMIAKEGLEYTVLAVYDLYTSVDDLINKENIPATLDSMTLLNTDSLIASNDSINDDYSTLEEIANKYEVSPDIMEVYSTQWTYNTLSWTSVYVVIHVNDYYIIIDTL